MQAPGGSANDGAEFEHDGLYEPYGGRDYFTLDFREVGETGGMNLLPSTRSLLTDLMPCRISRPQPSWTATASHSVFVWRRLVDEASV